MSDAALARKTYLKKRGARWYCRVRVRADLVARLNKTGILKVFRPRIIGRLARVLRLKSATSTAGLKRPV